MSEFTLLYSLAYIVIFIITLIFLIAFFPTNISFLSTVDGFHYDTAIDFGVLLGLLYGSVGFDPRGGSFKLWLFSLPIFNTHWVEEEQEPEEEPKGTQTKKRSSMRILFRPSKRLFESVTHNIEVKKFDVSVNAGLSDPYISGLIFGVVYPIVEMMRIYFPLMHFSLTPVFVEERFRSRLDGDITLRMILFIVPLLSFFLSKEYREYTRM